MACNGLAKTDRKTANVSKRGPAPYACAGMNNRAATGTVAWSSSAPSNPEREMACA